MGTEPYQEVKIKLVKKKSFSYLNYFPQRDSRANTAYLKEKMREKEKKITSLKRISCCHTKILLHYIDDVQKTKMRSLWVDWAETRTVTACFNSSPDHEPRAEHTQQNTAIADVYYQPGPTPAAL